MAAGLYTVVTEAQTIATAITVLEVTLPATAIGRFYRAWLKQTGVAAQTRFRVQILRKTATITGTASPPTPRPKMVGFAASGCTVKHVATAEGTDGVILDSEAEDHLYGWEWRGGSDNDKSGLWVPPSGIIAIKFPAAPTSASWTCGFEYEEIG